VGSSTENKKTKPDITVLPRHLGATGTIVPMHSGSSITGNVIRPNFRVTRKSHPEDSQGCLAAEPIVKIKPKLEYKI
jgi:hypothetical protein